VTTSSPGPATPGELLAGLDPDRRELLVAVHDVLAGAVPPGYAEAVTSGMITWSVPLERYPDTYNGQPLQYVALAAQKRYSSVYLMALYAGSELDRRFRERWQAGGRRLDMGKACLRFRRLDDLDLDLLAETVAALPVDDYLALYESVRAGSGRR
jgi:hypothetical protein